MNINTDNISQNIFNQLQQGASSTSDLENQNKLDQALIQAGLPQNKLNNIIELTRDTLMCDSNCQRDRKAQELRKKFFDAEQNLCSAPEEVIDAEKNFYIYTKGERGYENMLLKRYGDEACAIKEKAIRNHKKLMKLLELLSNDYKTDKINLNRMNELLGIRLNENKKLKKTIYDSNGIANTNDRKVVYETREMDWLKTVRKILTYLLIILVILYLFFGNFFKRELYKNLKIWLIILCIIVYIFSVDLLSRITFWVFDKMNYLYNNKAPRNVYINL